MSRKYDRQIELLNYLLHSGRTTVLNLSNELGVCVHTIKRDIADLQYHFPIFTYTGRGGGVELNACFSFNGYLLTRENVMLIKQALELLAETDNICAPEARSLLYKVFHVKYA